MSGIALEQIGATQAPVPADFGILHIPTPLACPATGPGDDAAITGLDAVAKRALDVLVATACLLLLAPFLAAVAAAIRLETPGPILFRQRRTGLGGAVIEVWKFRSMRADASDAGGAVQTCRGDARVTRVGRFIRATSVDELPQLVNVLQGRMSLVGPRPHALQTRCRGLALPEAMPGYASRYRVKPGLTGLAQVMGYRGELDSLAKLRGRVRYDRLYIERWSPALDLWILAATALLVLRDRNAY